MNQEGDVAKQREYMRTFEKLTLDEHANSFITLWWYRIVPHRSYMKGWNISPSHYVNQDLAPVWIDKIGRASCRERVCQYVSIPVDAVSLKKKTNHNDIDRQSKDHIPTARKQCRQQERITVKQRET